MTGIAPGAYVRVTRGMYAGTTGRVVSVAVSGDGPWATLDVAEAQRVGVYLSALELVGAVPTVEQERDAAIAERDRLRRELEELRDECAESPSWWDHAPLAARLDAILRGES